MVIKSSVTNEAAEWTWSNTNLQGLSLKVAIAKLMALIELGEKSVGNKTVVIVQAFGLLKIRKKRSKKDIKSMNKNLLGYSLRF
jgi:hypothetical protein